ncbi:MAG: PQQ-binding-like beta-propeller repeat protein [Bryobacteraceae bacterium]|nr:PQQ-binding-like beta-propeller repeat protein [Bryobacteraceae bacterium]MDW8377518.1 PQQ-binding-like beta-propeller repeat protein [Bryobacterales bacterium]
MQKRKTILISVFSVSLSVFGTDLAHWTRWRGPHQNGVAPGDVPTEWSDNKNVAWKTTIPGRGHSSPVIYGNTIYLTTAIPVSDVGGGQPASPPRPPAGPASSAGTDQPPAAGPPLGEPRAAEARGSEFRGRRGPGGFAGGSAAGVEHRLVVLALDRNTGKILWERSPRTIRPHEGYHRIYGSFASNSPVTDGKHLWAFFGQYGVFCYSAQGELVWKKDDFPKISMRNAFGEGTAAVLEDESLILNFDSETESFLLVLDKNTGKQRWRVPRDEASSWSQPLVVKVGDRKQVIVSATKKVRAYDLADGRLIWECAGLGANVIPAPVSDGKVVYVMSGFRDPNLMAIQLGREGDLTGSDAILWTNQRGNSYTPSPVLVDGKLYFVTDSGMVSCLDAKTGQPYYLQQRLPKSYNIKASPVAVNGKLYIATENEDVVVLKLGEKYEVLATNTLADQMFIASPAIADGSLYLRGQNTLYCIRQR